MFLDVLGARAIPDPTTVVAADGHGNGDDPQSEFVRNLADVFAAHERALIAERTRNALRVKQSRGERTGSIRYGFRRRSMSAATPMSLASRSRFATTRIPAPRRRRSASAAAKVLHRRYAMALVGSPGEARLRRFLLWIIVNSTDG